MNVCGFGLTLEGPFEHLLGRNILAAVELDDASIVKRVGIARKNAFRSQARLCNREIRSRTRRDFCYLRVFLYENSKLIPRLSKPASGKLLVRPFECDKRCRLILSRWSRRRWLSWRGSNGSNRSNRSLLLRRFDP